mmetsp:Transcript_74180/g.197815  ORF Transcript_74180/g.197815 Transcript_74180/m.197815 type:complete len:204 (-) Transcript_74180:893-1504(-)
MMSPAACRLSAKASMVASSTTKCRSPSKKAAIRKYLSSGITATCNPSGGSRPWLPRSSARWGRPQAANSLCTRASTVAAVSVSRSWLRISCSVCSPPRTSSSSTGESRTMWKQTRVGLSRSKTHFRRRSCQYRRPWSPPRWNLSGGPATWFSIRASIDFPIGIGLCLQKCAIFSRSHALIARFSSSSRGWVKRQLLPKAKEAL